MGTSQERRDMSWSKDRRTRMRLYLFDGKSDFLQFFPHGIFQLLDIDPLCPLRIVDSFWSHSFELSESQSSQIFLCFRNWIWFISIRTCEPLSVERWWEIIFSSYLRITSSASGRVRGYENVLTSSIISGIESSVVDFSVRPDR